MPAADAVSLSLPGVSLPGLPVSPGGFLQDSVVHGEVCHQLLQPGVLLLQLLKPLGLIHPKAAVLFSPVVIGLFANPDLTARLQEALPLCLQNICFPELRNDLLRCVSLLAHTVLPLSSDPIF